MGLPGASRPWGRQGARKPLRAESRAVQVRPWLSTQTCHGGFVLRRKHSRVPERKPHEISLLQNTGSEVNVKNLHPELSHTPRLHLQAARTSAPAKLRASLAEAGLQIQFSSWDFFFLLAYSLLTPNLKLCFANANVKSGIFLC